jgi:16S rRNA processing protein RimM
VPFVAAIVPSVDIKAGTVTLTPPPGLIEDLPDDQVPADADPSVAPDGDA